MTYSHFWCGALVSILALGACQHHDDDAPSPVAQQLVGKAWLLTETRLNGQVTGRDTTIKDQYSWMFDVDQSYYLFPSQGNSGWTPALRGQWRLTNQGQNLHTTDHKAAPHAYDILQLDASTLKLRWQERAGEVHEDTFTR